MPLITTSSGPEFDEGTYPLEITSVKPKTIVPKQGKQAGQEVGVLEWDAAMLDPDTKERLVDEKSGEPLVANFLTSSATGPKAKATLNLIALFGPEAAEPGFSVEEEDLIGKRALGRVIKDGGGYPKVEGELTALPRSRRPVAAAPQARPPVASDDGPDTDDDLPF